MLMQTPQITSFSSTSRTKPSFLSLYLLSRAFLPVLLSWLPWSFLCALFLWSLSVNLYKIINLLLDYLLSSNLITTRSLLSRKLPLFFPWRRLFARLTRIPALIIVINFQRLAEFSSIKTHLLLRRIHCLAQNNSRNNIARRLS